MFFYKLQVMKNKKEPGDAMYSLLFFIPIVFYTGLLTQFGAAQHAHARNSSHKFISQETGSYR